MNRIRGGISCTSLDKFYSQGKIFNGVTSWQKTVFQKMFMFFNKNHLMESDEIGLKSLRIEEFENLRARIWVDYAS